MGGRPTNPLRLDSRSFSQFVWTNLDRAKNLKWLLSCFEHLSGMRVNFHKYDLVPINVISDEAQAFAQNLGCKLGSFPIKYLGMPVSYTNLRNSDWEFIVVKYLKRFEAWIGYAASMGGRLTLLDSVLTQLSIFHMSMWLMNKTFIDTRT